LNTIGVFQIHVEGVMARKGILFLTGGFFA